MPAASRSMNKDQQRGDVACRVPKLRVQMVLLEKNKQYIKSELPGSTEVFAVELAEPEYRLLEVLSDCDWSSVHSRLLGFVAAVCDGRVSPARQSTRIDDFYVMMMKPSSGPVQLPAHLHKKLGKQCSVPSARVMVVKSTGKDQEKTKGDQDESSSEPSGKVTPKQEVKEEDEENKGPSVASPEDKPSTQSFIKSHSLELSPSCPGISGFRSLKVSASSLSIGKPTSPKPTLSVVPGTGISALSRFQTSNPSFTGGPIRRCHSPLALPSEKTSTEANSTQVKRRASLDEQLMTSKRFCGETGVSSSNASGQMNPAAVASLPPGPAAVSTNSKALAVMLPPRPEGNSPVMVSMSQANGPTVLGLIPQKTTKQGEPVPLYILKPVGSTATPATPTTSVCEAGSGDKATVTPQLSVNEPSTSPSAQVATDVPVVSVVPGKTSPLLPTREVMSSSQVNPSSAASSSPGGQCGIASSSCASDLGVDANVDSVKTEDDQQGISESVLNTTETLNIKDEAADSTSPVPPYCKEDQPVSKETSTEDAQNCDMDDPGGMRASEAKTNAMVKAGGSHVVIKSSEEGQTHMLLTYADGSKELTITDDKLCPSDQAAGHREESKGEEDMEAEGALWGVTYMSQQEGDAKDGNIDEEDVNVIDSEEVGASGVAKTCRNYIKRTSSLLMLNINLNHTNVHNHCERCHQWCPLLSKPCSLGEINVSGRN